jgi:hypothetical protein
MLVSSQGSLIMKSLLIFTLLFIPFLSTANTCHSLKDIAWVLGSWESTNQDSVITESWGKVSEITFDGEGATYSEGKLKATESLRMVEMSQSVFYLAKVSHNPLPVAFKLIKCADGNAIFENLNHDFPKRIEYKSTEANSMMVIVSDAKEKGFTVDFIRSNAK